MNCCVQYTTQHIIFVLYVFQYLTQHVNKVIDEQLNSIHQQNNMLAAEMGRMGLSSQPTVAEWLEKKNKQKKEELRNSLIHWKRLISTWPV